MRLSNRSSSLCSGAVLSEIYLWSVGRNHLRRTYQSGHLANSSVVRSVSSGILGNVLILFLEISFGRGLMAVALLALPCIVWWIW